MICSFHLQIKSLLLSHLHSTCDERNRQCRINLHIDSTYLQTYTEDNVQYTHTCTQYTQCTIRHTYSYTLYTVCTHSTLCTQICTHMRRCNRLYISWTRNVMDVHCACICILVFISTVLPCLGRNRCITTVI